MSYFDANLTLIRSNDPHLADRLLRARSAGGRSAPPAPSVLPKNLDKDLAGERMVITLGIGDGRLFEQVVANSSDELFALLIEPDPNAMVALLEHRDWTDLLSEKRVSLAIAETPENAVIIRSELYFDLFALARIVVVENKFPPSAQAYYDEIKKSIGQLRAIGIQNISTLTFMGPIWRKNSLENLPTVLLSPPVSDLFDKFLQVPAVIVAAGPSLDKNAIGLSAMKGRGLIIAVDTAVRALDAVGVMPDMVVAVDPLANNYLHLKGSAALKEAIMILNPSINPQIVAESGERKYFSRSFDPFFLWVERELGDLGELCSGGSVAAAAFDLAIKMGCAPITFMGQDLSYERGRSHAAGSVPQHMSSDYLLQESAVATRNIFGAEVAVVPKMSMLRSWYELRIARCGTAVCNTTEGGIFIEGAEHMSLGEFMARHWNVSAIWPETKGAASVPSITRLVDSMEQVRDEARQIKRLCGTATGRLKHMADEAEEIEIVSPDELDALINQINDYRLFGEINHIYLQTMVDEHMERRRRAKTAEPSEDRQLTLKSFAMFFAGLYQMVRQFEHDFTAALPMLRAVEQTETGQEAARSS